MANWSQSTLPLYHQDLQNAPKRKICRRITYLCSGKQKMTRVMSYFLVVLMLFGIGGMLASPLREPEVVIPARNPLKDPVEPALPAEKTKRDIPIFNGPSNYRQKAVREAFQHAWIGYEKFAWGHDQLKPVSKSYSDWFKTGLTIVDALDTAIIMKLDKEVKEGTEWIRDELTFDKDGNVSLFEITIRVLGGLLSSFHLTGDKMFVEKAEDLAERLLHGFSDKSPIPSSDVNLKQRTATNPSWSTDSSLSEVTSLQLEFRDLARITGNRTYEDVVFAVSEHIHKIGCKKHGGLCEMFISSQTGKFKDRTTITFGARADSYYEYLLKQWLQTGKTIDWLKEDYSQAMVSMKEKLLRESSPNKFLFIGELLSGETYYAKMDHLVCFLAGTLALGAQNGLPGSHMEIAEKLGETCHQMYVNPTGLGPEIAHFNMIGTNDDLFIKPLDAHCLLRPEAVEAWFYLYRFTGDKRYQEYGWSAFQAIERYARVSSGGYSSISNVKNTKVQMKDMMESFYLAETLKYLYLLFDEDQTVLPLDKWVYNTEAHPFPIRNH